VKKVLSSTSGKLDSGLITYYLHDSIRNDSGYTPIIREHRLTTKHDDHKHEWMVTLPNGSFLILTSAKNREEALQGGGERLLRDHWTTDRSVAVRRAAKMVELQASGKLKVDRSRSANQKACQEEILAIK
jgi:hypothetical protein